MSAVTYTCPKCQTTLRPAKPVPPGKKVRCPKCENVFVPDPADAAIQARPSAAGGDGDEEGAGTYGVVKDPDLEKKAEEDEEEDFEYEDDEEGDEDEDGRPRKKKNVCGPSAKRSAPIWIQRSRIWASSVIRS